MNWGGALTVFAKELKDVLRDRRTMISMILVPILFFPLISIGFGSFMSSQIQKSRDADHPVLILPRDADLVLTAAIDADERLHAVSPDSILRMLLHLAETDSTLNVSQIEQLFSSNPDGIDDSIRSTIYYAAVAKKSIRAVIELPTDLTGQLSAGDSLSFAIFVDETDIKSDAAGDRLSRWAKDYRDSLARERLAAQGLDVSYLKPYWIMRGDIAPESKRSGRILSVMLPYMLMMVMIMGGMYPALDITAGEKERSTLETLLAAPVSRWDIAVGKFLTVFTTSLVTTILSTLSMILTTQMSSLTSATDSGATFAINGATVALVIALMIPAAMLFSAILITVAIAARSYKEGQSYVTPIMMAVILPAMISMVPGIEFDWFFTVIPVVNICMSLKGVLLGVYDPAKIGVVFAVTTFYAAIALFVTSRIFERESVLFRT